MEIPGEALVAKLWETVADKGIANLLKPWQMRREGRASIELRREEALVMAQAERDADLIRRGEISLVEVNSPPRALADRSITREGKKRIEPYFDSNELVRMATNVALADTVRRELNVANALLHAEAELENDTQTPPDESIDNDWLFRWRDCASQVSSDELQTLWGKILAGEIKAPGSYSLRTLEFLKNLSQSEAAAITKLSQFVINEHMIFKDPDLLSNEGISFDFLLNMENLGVISGAGLNLHTTWESTETSHFICALTSNEMVLVITHDNPEKKA